MQLLFIHLFNNRCFIAGINELGAIPRKIEIFDKMSNKIIESGPRNFKKSQTYLEKVKVIADEIKANYKSLLENEPNFIRRIILKIKIGIEIKRAISKLNSLDKMYIQTRMN